MYSPRQASDTALEEPGATVICKHCYTISGIDRGKFIGVSEWEDMPTAQDVHDFTGVPITIRCETAMIFRSCGLPDGYTLESGNVESWADAYDRVGHSLWPAFCRWAEDGVVVEDANNVPDVATFREQFCGWWPDFEEYALRFSEDTGLMDGVDADSQLRIYFDWSSWIEDLSYDYTVSATRTCEGGVFVYRNF
ncbi:TPA: antirestriction protein ArdA [Corynebacterium striatum]|nr:antirestriction protein ArdA [Corynebacterium striatum]